MVQIENPDGTTCYALDELAENESPVKLHNATATTAIVYESANCSGDSFELAPGEERAEEGMPAMSVAFADRQAAPADDQQAAPAEEAGPDQPMDEDEDAALEDEQAGPQRVAGDEHPHGIDRAAIVEDFLHAWG
ncbi:hypothetical protein [Streptomyces sp. NPDC089919]|uniref:hypothetical protein n=1 Tax=Streptomyces sp. NPDC089919 TaxID=3155188 RepID=UPI0034491600